MTDLDVFLDENGTSRKVGQAYVTRSRGEVSTTFVYDTLYLAGGGARIDPGLPLVSGSQHAPGLVRAFADSAPDRWGRNLIEKAERVRAREEQRAPRRMDDLDFLLGVSDDTRQGALRFRLSGTSAFLGDATATTATMPMSRWPSATCRPPRDATFASSSIASWRAPRWATQTTTCETMGSSPHGVPGRSARRST